MRKLTESTHIMTGGRPSTVISDQKAWKMGHAISGSRAPSSQRRARVVSGRMAIGRSCCFVTFKVSRMALLALPICWSQFAV